VGNAGAPILILDTSVLINFLAIDRARLLSSLASPVLITSHIVAEVAADYPDQQARLAAALQAGYLKEIEVIDLAELALFAELVSRDSSKRKRLGEGECSAIAVAVHRGYHLGIEDRQAIKQVKERYPTVVIRQTQHLMVELIQAKLLTVTEADQIKQTWSAEHRFDLKLATFADLVLPRNPK
jgi:predicted nucleic acid-binding protein